MKHVLRILALLGAAFLATNVYAKNGGGPGGGPHNGAPGDHMSDNGLSNTNKQSLPDSNRGLDRAHERMSDKGMAHEKTTKKDAQDKANKKKAKKPPKPETLKLPDAPKP